MWKEPFKKRYTTDERFTLPDGNKVPVKLMAQTANFFYTENNDYQVLELPYKGDSPVYGGISA